MKINIRVTMLCAAVVCIAVLLSSTDAVAKRGSDRNSFRVHVTPQAAHLRTAHSSFGRNIQRLPYTNHVIRHGARSHSYYSGSFYWPRPHGIHIGLSAPFGSRVHSLSPGYVSFGFGSHRYFYSNFTYYLRDSRTQEYIVVEEPSGAEAVVVAVSESDSGEIFVYPNLGQSDEQRERDRYECYLWAQEQTSFDPGAASPDMESAGDYRRASSACLEGRGYTVK